MYFLLSKKEKKIVLVQVSSEAVLEARAVG